MSLTDKPNQFDLISVDFFLSQLATSQNI